MLSFMIVSASMKYVLRLPQLPTWQNFLLWERRSDLEMQIASAYLQRYIFIVFNLQTHHYTILKTARFEILVHFKSFFSYDDLHGIALQPYQINVMKI